MRPSRAYLQGWEPPPAGESTQRSTTRPRRERDDSTLSRNALGIDWRFFHLRAHGAAAQKLAGVMAGMCACGNRLRAVLLLNLALESVMAAGYAISSDAKGASRAFVFVLDLKLSFKIRERNRREPITLTREQRQKNEQVGFNFYTQQYEYHLTGEFDIAVTEPDSSYELAKIGDIRTASVETKVVAFIVRLRELAIRRRVKAQIDAKRQVIAEAKVAEGRRRAEIRMKALDRLKQVEEWASKLERANRLRSLADKFETEKLSSNDGVIDAGWIRRAADWLDPTVIRHWDDVDGPRGETVE